MYNTRIRHSVASSTGKTWRVRCRWSAILFARLICTYAGILYLFIFQTAHDRARTTNDIRIGYVIIIYTFIHRLIFIGFMSSYLNIYIYGYRFSRFSPSPFVSIYFAPSPATYGYAPCGRVRTQWRKSFFILFLNRLLRRSNVIHAQREASQACATCWFYYLHSDLGQTGSAAFIQPCTACRRTPIITHKPCAFSVTESRLSFRHERCHHNA